MSCNCENKQTPSPFSIVEAVKSSSIAVSSIAKGIMDPQQQTFVSDEVKNARLDACKSCENLVMTLGKMRCGICGCFLAGKTSMTEMSCPHPEGSKWKE